MKGTSPRVLLAEDDPVSLEFLAAALRELGCEVEAVADGDQAAAAALEQRFDLLILDHRMPGADGVSVLEIARAEPHAPNRDVPAIATTADPEPRLHQRLRSAGFGLVLPKPSGKSRLREAFRELGLPTGTKEPALFDDEAGLAASGSVEILGALRALFATELEALARDFDALLLDRAALGQRLHRLRAACGFCGAMALQGVAAELSGALQDGDTPRIAACADEFLTQLEATRAALGGN